MLVCKWKKSHEKEDSSVQSLRLFATPWITARQASLSITNSRSLPKPMPIESVTPSSHLILCRPFLLLPSSFPASVQFSVSVKLLSPVRLFVSPWTATRQASLFITNSWRPPKPMSIDLVMPSNHLIFCRPLLLPPSISPSIRVFSNESALRIRWPKYWSFRFKISYINAQDWSPLGWTGWISLQSKGLSRVFSNITVQKHQFFSTQLSL